METTLHRQLKALYTDDPQQREVTVDGYRIDAVCKGELIEVQCASLSAIRDKVAALLETHRVRVVKPIVARRFLITRRSKRGPVVSRRYSPARGDAFDLFEELVHFVTVFPHPRLSLELLLVEIEERRSRRKPRRWKDRNYRVLDRSLTSVESRRLLSGAGDLLAFLPDELLDPFTTADLSDRCDIPRWLAQKVAYCLRKTGAALSVEKRGRLRLYRRAEVSPRKSCRKSA